MNGRFVLSRSKAKLTERSQVQPILCACTSAERKHGQVQLDAPDTTGAAQIREEGEYQEKAH